jgi:hypothetical protein
MIPVMDSGVEKIIGSSEVWYNAGYESIIGRLQGQMSVDLLRLPCPRAQFAIKPDWEKIWSLGFQEVYTISHRSTESLEMLQEWYSQM